MRAVVVQQIKMALPDAYPRYFATKSLVGKQMSGVGMPTQTWTYAYSAVNGQGNWSTCTGACPETKTVTVTGPDGANKVMTFGTRHNTTDGKLLRTDEYSTAGALLRTTAQAYRIGREMGLSVLDMGDGATSSMRQDPLSSKTITQQGVAFNWYGDAVDSFDRTTQERRVGPGGTRTETTTYSDNYSVWVLGQVRQVANSGGQLMVDRDFDPATATLKAVREFGVLKESIDYNLDGTVSGRRDGANHLTRFGDYKRGIARLVTYADNTTEQVQVNDLGWITSHTNQASYTTGYGYDNNGDHIVIAPQRNIPFPGWSGAGGDGFGDGSGGDYGSNQYGPDVLVAGPGGIRDRLSLGDATRNDELERLSRQAEAKDRIAYITDTVDMLKAGATDARLHP